MEDGIKKQPEPSSKETNSNPLPLTEVIDEWCLFYMNIGLSYDEFWYGDPRKLPYYYKAYAKKKETDFEKRNYELYLQGLYNYRAFSSVMNAFEYWFNGNKGIRPQGYLDGVIPHTKGEIERYNEKENEKSRKFFEKGQQ